MSVNEEAIRHALAALAPYWLKEKIKAALEGDSNDAEHDALVEVASVFRIEWEDGATGSDGVDIETVDGQQAFGLFVEASDATVKFRQTDGELKYIEWPFVRSIRFPNRGG